MRAILRLFAVLAPVIGFWALFFQYGSSWTLQAERMRRDVLGVRIAAGQVQTLDAALVLTLIPVFSVLVFPALERRGIRVTPLRKMTVGMFVTVLSFVAAAGVEAALAAGGTPHVGWQIPQYLFLVVGEVLVSVTGLEFAYAQAPRRWKSVIMGIWYLTIAVGSLLTAVVAWLNRFQGVAFYAFFAALMLGAAVAFALVAWWYRPVEAARAAPEPA
jgi:POT family proton-dependent oligopeptide transporter